MPKMRAFILLSLLFISLPFNGCYAQTKELSAAQTKELSAAQTKELSAAKEDKTDPYAWDFGKVKEGKVVEHAFIFENKTNKTLKITGINTSCGCTSSEVKDKTLLPGQATRVVVRFDSKGYAVGKIVHQHVYVDTDDADNPVLKFKIQTEIAK